MRYFLSELYRRNALLLGFGMVCLLGMVWCMAEYTHDIRFVAGVNLWLKPLKFFLSFSLFAFTMGWLLEYLHNPGYTRWYSRVAVCLLSFELLVITWQAYHGRLSHYNTSTPLYRYLFMGLGIGLLILVFWTGHAGYRFFRLKRSDLPESYLWGIRLGILLFVLFSLEGAYMFARYSHTIGGPDGSPGLPVLNWSRYYGDLRVSHFVGIHSLQVLPLIGWYSTRQKKWVFLFAAVYGCLALVLLIQAIEGIPFI